MDKIKKIDDFLHLIAEISKNGVQIDSNLIYSNLIRIGTQKNKIENYFVSWDERFTKVPNLKIYISPKMNGFLQFDGYGKEEVPNSFIKLYVPLDIFHVYHGVNKIFDYISKSDIPHKSKVRRYTGLDDVTIRVDSLNSLSSLRNFISNDEYIMEGLLEPNPFAISDGTISYVWDGELSYNLVVSEWISEYIDAKKDNLDSISYSSFFEYVGRRYKEVFQNGKDINSFFRGRDFANSTEMLANYQRVTELLLISLREESKLIDFYKFYEFVKNPESEKEVIQNITRLKQKDSKKMDDIPNEVKEAFDYVFLELSKKNSLRDTIKLFKAFSVEGNYQLFSKDNGIRTLMEEVMDISYAKKLIYDEEKEALINASLSTIEQYNAIQLGRALFGVQDNDYDGFTNINGERERLKLWIQPNEISDVIHDILAEVGCENTKSNEEYWIFLEMISKLKEKGNYGK